MDPKILFSSGVTVAKRKEVPCCSRIAAFQEEITAGAGTTLRRFPMDQPAEFENRRAL